MPTLNVKFFKAYEFFFCKPITKRSHALVGVKEEREKIKRKWSDKTHNKLFTNAHISMGVENSQYFGSNEIIRSFDRIFSYFHTDDFHFLTLWLMVI